MLEKSFALFYYLKQSKNAVKGKYVYLRITVNGEIKEFSTKRIWSSERWNQTTGRAIGTKEDARTLNEYLDNLSVKVQQIKNERLSSGKPISAELLRDILMGKDEETMRSLLGVLKVYLLEVENLLGIDYKLRTLKRYKTTYTHLQKFLTDRYYKDDISLKEVNFEFIDQFTVWLKTEKSCTHNSAIKYLEILRKVLTSCLRKEWIKTDPFAHIKLSAKPTNISCLNKEELEKIQKKKITIERIAIVRDIFLFSCYTGLAYIDVLQLKRTQLMPGIDGSLWIFTEREKTNTPTRVPLLPMAINILEKYKDHSKCHDEGYALPVISNQKMNAYLKEIADICGINKKLTFHIARHTFATTVTLSNGVPLETVSKILGHKTVKQTQHYAKVIDSKISEDINMLKVKLRL